MWRSSELVKGYSVAMALEGPPLQLWLGIVAGFVTAGVAVAFAFSRREPLWSPLITLAPLYVAFRHGFASVEDLRRILGLMGLEDMA